MTIVKTMNPRDLGFHLLRGCIVEEYNGMSLGVVHTRRNYMYYKISKSEEYLLAVGHGAPVADLSKLNFTGKYYTFPSTLYGTRFIVHENGVRSKELKLVPDELNIVGLI